MTKEDIRLIASSELLLLELLLGDIQAMPQKGGKTLHITAEFVSHNGLHGYGRQ
jgi:hypothetical protein